VELKPGVRLRSQVCDTEVVVIKAGAGGELACGGAPMVPKDDPSDPGATLDPDRAGGTLLGKRYTDGSGTVELLCVKPGAGTLTLDGTPLEVKAAKALPASD
jgi:hypothetical protein